jgi:hypothetical protein
MTKKDDDERMSYDAAEQAAEQVDAQVGDESESVDDMIAYAKAHGIRVGRLSVIELERRIAEHREEDGS